MIGRRTGPGMIALSLMVFLSPALEAQDDTFEWSGRLAQGEVIQVKGIVGDVRATLASGDRVEVVARKRGERDDFHQVAIEVAEDGNATIICAVYGEWRHGEDYCHPDHRDEDDWRGRRHRNVDMEVEVDFEVRVPAGVDFIGGTVSGDVRAEGLESDVSASTVDGDVWVETTGQGWGNTVSGNIEVDMGDFGEGDIDFNTVSGDITLWLPGDFSADVEFSSLSGDLDSDFDLRVERRRNRRWIGSKIEGTIGEGGRELSLHTVSGDVELRRKNR